MTEVDFLKSVSRTLATRNLDTAQLTAIASAMESSAHPVLGAEICTHGICINVGVSGSLGDINLRDILEIATGPIRHIEIFPEGIIVPDRARVRLTHAL